jgi:hypothetical protein
MTFFFCAVTCVISASTALAFLSSSQGRRTLDDVALELEKVYQRTPTSRQMNRLLSAIPSPLNTSKFSDTIATNK